MSNKYDINVSFREELIGDEKDSSDFYLKITPVVKYKLHTDEEANRKAAVEALVKELIKKKIKVTI